MKKAVAVFMAVFFVFVGSASACLYCDIDNNYDIEGGDATIKDNVFKGGDATIKNNTFEGGSATATIEEGAIVINPDQTIKQKVKQSVVVEAPDMTPVGDGLTNMGESIKKGMNNQAKAHVVGTVITEIGDSVEQIIENKGNKDVQKLENKGKVKVQKLENKGNKEVAEIERASAKEVAEIMKPKRDHIRGPEILKSDPKLTNGKAPDSKTYGAELLDHIDSLFMKQAKKLSSKSTDVEVLPALLFENDFQTNRVYIEDHSEIEGDERGNLMGYFYADCEGKKCNAAGMIGEVAEKAMKVGATHIYLEDKDKVKAAMGSSWNVGLGGGASIMTNGDETAIAPNGGLGFGKASASNEMRPAMAFSVWFDDATIVKKKAKQDAVDYSNER